MYLKYLLLGMIVQLVTSLDDTVTKLPIILGTTRTRRGRVAFALGTLPAVAVIIVVVQAVSAVVRHLAIFQYLAGGIVIGIALMMLFQRRPAKPIERVEERLIRRRGISMGRFVSLMGFGFAITFLTSLDDSLAFIPLLGQEFKVAVFSVLGITASTIVNMVLLVLFAEKLQKVRYIKRVSAILLLVFGMLILAGII